MEPQTAEVVATDQQLRMFFTPGKGKDKVLLLLLPLLATAATAVAAAAAVAVRCVLLPLSSAALPCVALPCVALLCSALSNGHIIWCRYNIKER